MDLISNSHLVIIDLNEDDGINSGFIKDEDFFIEIETLLSSLLIGPFETLAEARDYMNSSTTPHVSSKIIITGTQARKLLP